MKNLLLISIAVILLAGGTTFAQGIADTNHDLSTGSASGGAVGTSDEICIYCHTPHGGADLKPLWNRAAPADGPYTPYTNSSIDATTGNAAGVSLMCLSCHDGVTVLGAIVGGGVGLVAGGDVITGTADIWGTGTGMQDDHPVSFTYDATLVSDDGHLVNEGTVAAGGYLFGPGSDQVECASCHDVHNGANVAPFLRETNAGSALCLKCHVK